MMGRDRARPSDSTVQVATGTRCEYLYYSMKSATTIDPTITMRELLEQFPGAQRALFRKYHIGGCSSCGFAPDETLAGVWAWNDNLAVAEVIQQVIESPTAARAMKFEPQEI